MEEILQLTKDLIRFKSIHTISKAIKACADFIEGYLKKHGLEYQRVEYDGIPSIVVLSRKSFAPMLLMSHFDVVHGPDELLSHMKRMASFSGAAVWMINTPWLYPWYCLKSIVIA